MKLYLKLEEYKSKYVINHFFHFMFGYIAEHDIHYLILGTFNVEPNEIGIIMFEKGLHLILFNAKIPLPFISKVLHDSFLTSSIKRQYHKYNYMINFPIKIKMKKGISQKE